MADAMIKVTLSVRSQQLKGVFRMEDATLMVTNIKTVDEPAESIQSMRKLRFGPKLRADFLTNGARTFLRVALLVGSLSLGIAAEVVLAAVIELDPDTGATSIPCGADGMCNTAACCNDPDCPASVNKPCPNGGVYLPSNITVEDCSNSDAQRIGFAVDWLKDNMALIDAKMRQSPHLMFWPDNSRENFREKLDKDLKFVCINEKNKCDPDPSGSLYGRTYPVAAQKRINLCTVNINAATGDPTLRDAFYISTISHEIGHLVRLNGHTKDCVKNYTDPSFSGALGLAAEYAFRGISYDPGYYTKHCPGQSLPPFDWRDKLGNMEKPMILEK